LAPINKDKDAQIDLHDEALVVGEGVIGVALSCLINWYQHVEVGLEESGDA
jgi:hypothetical protein